MRQIKRVVDRLELVLRCYPGTPIDLPLLVKLALEGMHVAVEVDAGLLKRSALLPAYGATCKSDLEKHRYSLNDSRKRFWSLDIEEKFPELLTLPEARCESPAGNYYPWYRVAVHLSQHYVPRHQAMLDHVHRLQAGA